MAGMEGCEMMMHNAMVFYFFWQRYPIIRASPPFSCYSLCECLRCACHSPFFTPRRRDRECCELTKISVHVSNTPSSSDAMLPVERSRTKAELMDMGYVYLTHSRKTMPCWPPESDEDQPSFNQISTGVHNAPF